MQEQIVRSYVRHKQEDVIETKEPSMLPALAVIVPVSIMVVIALWQVTVPAMLVVSAVYGIKNVYMQPKSVAVLEPVQEAVIKPTRHYQHRLKVTHYQTGKTISV